MNVQRVVGLAAIAAAGVGASVWSMAGSTLANRGAPPAPADVLSIPHDSTRVHHRRVNVDGLEIFYREAGPTEGPVVLLLHGFPTSSHMFRDLIPALAAGGKYRVIAPDYPGFGQSAMPSVDEFEYSFENLSRVVDEFTRAVGIDRFVLYVQDYGAPIGYRIAAANPERVRGLIVQNGNAYEEGLREFWTPIRAYWKEQTPETTAAVAKFLDLEATRWQWTHGVRDESLISPDTWTIDQAGLDRPGNHEIQLQLFLSYATNLPLYPAWQAYFRAAQPPTLIVWGKNDMIFPAEGAEPYRRDLKNVDFNLLDTGHFALEDVGGVIAEKILQFLDERVN